MKIAIVGAGGVGGYFGGRLAQAGHEVVLIARGKHLQAINDNGLVVETPDDTFKVSNVSATSKPADVGTVSAVLVAVKGWQLPDAVSFIEPLLGEKTVVLPLLNGVDATEFLSSALHSGNVLTGLCGIVAKIEEPGKIKHLAIDPYIKFGEKDNTLSPRTHQLKEVLDSTGADIEIPDDINRAVWLKYIFIAPLSGVTAVTRSSPGVIRKIPQSREMLYNAVAEALAVGQAMGIDIGEKDLSDTMQMIDSIPVDTSTSMQRDIESGNRSELHTQTGTIVRLGLKYGVPTPVNAMMLAALLPQEQTAETAR